MSCLHCGKNKADYCEKCYQDLIAENVKLQKRLQKQIVINNEYAKLIVDILNKKLKQGGVK